VKEIDFSDVLLFLGLSLLGVGLFLWIGLPKALTVVGGLMWLMGIVPGWAFILKRAEAKS
jgi:hypothetical protein